MIKRILTKGELSTQSEIEGNLKYWLNQSPEDRISAVEYFRKQYYGSSARFQRFARVVQQQQS